MCAVLLFKGERENHTWTPQDSAAISNFDFGQRDCFLILLPHSFFFIKFLHSFLAATGCASKFGIECLVSNVKIILRFIERVLPGKPERRSDLLK